MLQQSDNHRLGTVLAAAGVLVLSFDALLVRLPEIEPSTVVFWRGLLMFVSLNMLMLLTGKLRQWQLFIAGGIAAGLLALSYGIGTSLFVYSIRHTSVANTVIILASTSFFAAMFSWFLLGEIVRKQTWIAIVAALLGVSIIVSDSLNSPNILGDSLALTLAALTGLTLTLARKIPDVPQLPVVATSGLIAAILSWLWASPLSPSSLDFAWLAIMGLLQMPLATLLIMRATRYLASPEVALFLLIETLLGPVWVWLALNEHITMRTLLGGAVVMSAVGIHTWLSLKHSARSAAEDSQKYGLSPEVLHSGSTPQNLPDD